MKRNFESFNGKLWDETLNDTLFNTLHQACVERATRDTTTITAARTHGSVG